MKFREIFRFELNYQLRRIWTLLFFITLFVISFLMTRDGALSEALVDEFFVNSSFSVAKVTIVGSLLWLVTAAAIAGDAGARDVALRMSALVYTTPISKSQYLGARFLAALSINSLLLLIVQLGILAAIYLPGVDEALVGPFQPFAFINCYLILALPNAIFGTAIQFALATTTGKPMTAYLGSFLLFVMSYVVGLFLTLKGQRDLANLLDPIGVHFILSELSHLWTTTEKNYRMITLEGVVLTNRLLWIGAGSIATISTYVTFRFRHRVIKTLKLPSLRIALPRLSWIIPYTSRLQAIAWTSFKVVVTSWPGIFMLVIIPLITIPVIIDQMEISGVPLLPTTVRVLGELTAPISAELSRWVVIPVLIIFFSGQLVWRERDYRVNEIMDSMPLGEWAPFLGKFFGLCAALGLFMMLQMISAIVAQSILGYQNFEVGLYIKVLFFLQLPEYILFALLAFVIHIVVNQKYISHLLNVIAYAIIALAPMFGLEHNLLIYGAGPGWSYTDMRGFGGTFLPWVSFKLYWFAWALLLSAAGKKFGGVTVWVVRVAAALIILSGGFIFLNTNIANDYHSEYGIKEQHANYEKEFGNYKNTAQLSLIKVSLEIDLKPEGRFARIKGVYLLKNLTAAPIAQLHLSTGLNYKIIKLEKPVAPGDTVSHRFKTSINPTGFTESGTDISITDGATHLKLEEYLPAVGYQAKNELILPGDRRKFGLAKRDLIPSLYDVEATKHREPGIEFEAIISTNEDQIAVAPGALIKKWSAPKAWPAKLQQYFHYKTSAPIGRDWPLFSSRYEVHNEDVNGVKISIYNYPSHTNNIDRLVEGTRASLNYYSSQFGPYPYDHLTLVEHPGNGSGMHADASIISFSEGFTQWGGKDTNGVDLPYAVAAHEMGHQWNIPYAGVEGAPVMSESVAWYLGIRMVEHSQGEDELRKLLDFMHRPYPYAPIRRGEPLLRGLDPYQSYRRGPFALYAMSEYIGEDKVNKALKNLLEKHTPDNTRLATTLDLFNELRSVTPDSLQYLLHDLFEVNTYWDLKIINATPEKLEILSKKIVADSAGVEREIPINDWIEIGLYNNEGTIHLQKHHITSEKQTIIIKTAKEPARAVIDPRQLLIDLKTDDNSMKVKKQ
jgi:ABC-2 type transport system permease protein